MIQKHMTSRLTLTVLLAGALFLGMNPWTQVQAQEFGIGSKAPSIDVEHWLQDGNGFFKPVTEFAEGKIYVVEFWATWCGPCIGSMPHLAELQNKYRGQDVQIISISDESVDEVKALLGRQNEEVGKSFADITSAYCLTTDPDRSVHKSYMEAAKQNGIPTSFIVGKTGLVEWIGHPMELDGPIEELLNDSWDREAYKKEMVEQKRFEENMQKIAMLAGSGKFKEALEIVDTEEKATMSPAIKEHWLSVRNGLKLSGGMVNDEVVTYYKGQIAEMKGNPQAIGQFAYSMYGAAQQGADISLLVDDAVGALNEEIKTADKQLLPLLHNTSARLFSAVERWEEAIAAQESAIDASDERVKTRLKPFLEELQAKSKKAEEKK